MANNKYYNLSSFAWEHFLNTTTDILFFKDTNSIYLAASLAFAHLLGKNSIDEIIGKSEHEFFPEDLADSYIKSDAKLLDRTEKSVTDVTPLTLPNGTKSHLLVTKTPYFDSEGNVLGICGIGHHISAENTGPAHHDATTSCIFDYSVVDDILHLQLSFGINSKNLQFDNYTDTCGQSDILHPDSAETVKAHLFRALTESRAGSFDIVCNFAGTGYMWHRVHYKTLTDNNEKPNRIIGQINNIQEEKHRDLLFQNLAGQMMQRAKNISYDAAIVSNVFSLMYNSSDIDKAIQSILEFIGSYYEVSRAYIFEDHESHLYCTNTFEWCAEGIDPQKEFLQKYEYQFEDGHNIYCNNFDEDGIFLCRDIHTLPQDQVEVLEPQGIRSMLQCAMHDDGVFSGFVGFDECTHARVWTGEQIGTLNLISRLLSIFIIKRKRQNDAAFTADFMSALDQNASFVYVVDPESYDIIFSNQIVRETFGDNLIGQKCYKALVDSDSPCSQCPMRMYHETGKSQATELLRPDGMWVLSQASPMHWQGRHMMMVTSTDVTKHRSATEELRVRNEEYSIVIKQSGKHIFRYDIPTTRINRFYDSSLVYGHRERVPNTPLGIVSQGLISPDTVDDYMHFFNSIADQIPTGSMDVQIMQSNGTYRWFHYDYTLVDNPDGKAVSAIVSIGDIDVETRATLELTRRAERDGMTGLYNKAATEEISARVLSVTTGEACALMVIDLDNLKTINDTLGHAEGDNAINGIASIIRDHFRNTDIVGRIGGDEFLILLQGAITESTLRASLASLVRKVTHSKIGNTENNMSCSIGAALGRCGKTDYETLFKQADTALYQVKRNGKRGFALYSPDMDEENYSFSNKNRLSLTNTDWFDASELSKLFTALSVMYPLVISVNLSKNSYYMMEYETFKAQSCPDIGNFDELISGGAQTFHPDDRQSFINAFCRENQLRAYRAGQKTITHTGRQLGDDGVFRLTKTTVIFTDDKTGDVCQITLSKPL